MKRTPGKTRKRVPSGTERAPQTGAVPPGSEHEAQASPEAGSEPPPTRSARRAQRTRSLLEKAALSAFVQVGVGATTIEMITERADLGKGTFYQHFSTKEALLVHLVDAALDRILDRISKALHGTTDIRSAIEAVVNAHLDHFQANREEFILFFQGHGAVNLLGASPEGLESSYLRYLERIEGFIRERLPASPGDVTLRRMACAIAGFAVGYLSFAILGLSEENLRHTYRPVRDGLVSGLTALIEKASLTPAERTGSFPQERIGPAPADRGPDAPERPAGPPQGPLPMTPP